MTTNDTDYLNLRDQIQGLLTETDPLAHHLAEWQKVETHWHIGDALATHIDAHQGSTYGRQVMRTLSRDLRLGQTSLYEMLRFRRVVADLNLYARTNCGWTHFRALIHLPPDQIEHFARLSTEHDWSTRQLKQAIEQDAGDPSASLGPASPLRPSFGEPWTYRVVADRLHSDALPAIDFGFHQVWLPDDRIAGFDAATVGSIVTLDGVADGTARARLRTDRPGLWTYLARVLRVVDGDTLDVVVDLGFGYRAFPRLRLRGIDTDELYTQTGQRARDFVEEAVADAHVVIATRKTDIYGRYLADVHYLPGCAEPATILGDGVYLNGQLLREGLAVRYLG